MYPVYTAYICVHCRLVSIALRQSMHLPFLVGLVVLRHIVRQRVVGIRRREQRLDRQKHRADLQRRRPFVWVNRMHLPLRISRQIRPSLSASAAARTNVRVVDLGEEAHLGRRHGVVLRKEKLELERAACVSQDTYRQTGSATARRSRHQNSAGYPHGASPGCLAPDQRQGALSPATYEHRKPSSLP